jgi:argininosuccinate lyase
MTLWGGRFSGKMDPDAWTLNASINFDYRLALQDIRGSQAWAGALMKANILTSEEFQSIYSGLTSVAEEFTLENFTFLPSDEDIHTAVERRLGEIIGPIAGKLHTGRSRNDQVATDFRLWFMDHIPELLQSIAGFQKTLIQRAERDMGIILPGYTHLQRAQPILLSHWWLAHFWPFHKDRLRLIDLSTRLRILPLGSGALAGTPFSIDRTWLAKELGFDSPSPNSLEAVSDRDFVAEFLFCAALIGSHLSRLSEMVVLYTSSEFKYFELSDAFSTGSSLMPQKKNPDIFELARGKSGSLLGYLTGFLGTLKGLPSAYDKDLQEDKVPVFATFDILLAILPVMAKALDTIKVDPVRMRAGIDSGMLATDLADYLVMKRVPFREAHSLAGQAVTRAAQLQVSLDKLPLTEYQSLHVLFDNDVYQVFDPNQSIARRASHGGTAKEAVLAQLEEAKACL